MTEAAPICVFISYARSDAAFAHALRRRLSDAGVEAVLDTPMLSAGPKTPAAKPAEGKPAHTKPADAGADAKRTGRIKALIEKSTIVAAVLSPDRKAKGPEQTEIELADEMQRPLCAVVATPLGDAKPPKPLDDLTPIDLSDGAPATAFAELLAALHAHTPWMRERAKLDEQARQWDGARRRSRLLLKGAALRMAERWRATPSGTAPQPDALHHAYIDASRRAGRVRRWLQLGTVGALGLCSTGLAGYALYELSQSQQAIAAAEERARIAEDKRRAADLRIEKVQTQLTAAEAGLDSSETRRAAAEARRAAAEARAKRLAVAGAVAASEQSAAEARAQTPDRAAAEANRSVAIGLVETLLLELGDSGAAAPGMADRALDQASAALDQLLAETPDDPELLRLRAQLLLRAGAVRQTLERPRDAEAAYREGAGILLELTRVKPRDAELRADLGEMLARTGALRLQTGDAVGAKGAYEAALRVARTAVETSPEAPDAQRRLSAAMIALARAHLQLGETEAATTVIWEALARSRQHISADPNAPGAMLERADALEAFGDLKQSEGALERARRAYVKSAALRRQAIEALGPENAAERRALAALLIKLHEVSFDGASEAALREAAAIAFDLEALGLLTPADSPWIAEMRRRLSEL